MSLQYSGTSGVRQELSTSISDLLDALRDACVAASMTDLDGIYATATLANTVLTPDSQFVDIDGPGGSIRYQFYTVTPPGPGVVPVLAIVGDPLTSFQNMQDAINVNDSNVYCTSAFFDPSPPIGQSGYGIVVRSRVRGTIGNQVTMTPAGAGFAVVTDENHLTGGGWRLLTGQTPQGLQGRILATESSTENRIISIRMASATEDFVTTSITPANTAGLTYRFVAGKYNLAAYQPGSSSATTSFLAQVPWIPDFLKPIRITSVTNASPIVVTTASAHGLADGDEVYINDCLDSATISSGTNTIPITLTISPQPWADDVVVAVSGTNPASGGDGIWNVANAQAGTIDLLYSVGFDVINSGTVRGPRTSTNGFATVTVVSPTQFSIDGSDGTDSGNYVTLSGIVAKTNAYPKQISRDLILLGSSSAAANPRTRLYSSGSNAQQIAINAVNYGAGSSNGDPRFLIAAPGVLWSNECAILQEPFIAVGPNGVTTPAVVVGQLWDMFLSTEATPVDSTTAFDSHDWVEFGQAATGILGSIWVVEP